MTQDVDNVINGEGAREDAVLKQSCSLGGASGTSGSCGTARGTLSTSSQDGDNVTNPAPAAPSAPAASATEPAAPAAGAVTGGVTFPCEQDGVLKLIPHRDPFVWVTRILSCEPSRHIVAELYVDPELPLFKGHFPQKPVLPGVILMEALAQAACCCLMADPSRAGTIGLFAGIDKAKFRKQVQPGDTVRLEATITRASRLMCAADVKAYLGDDVCAQAQQKYVIDRTPQSGAEE